METYNQSLGKPEAEDQLGSSHEKLGSQSLEESSEALVLCHVGDDSETTLRVLKVSHLNASLDNVKRGGDDKRSRGTADRSDKVLAPCSSVVVLEVVDVLLSSGGTTEESERAWRIAGSGPAPAAVKAESLISNNLEETTATERLRVCLALDLEDVKWEQDNLSDTNQTVYKQLDHGLRRSESAYAPSSSRVHDGLACSLSECPVELVAMVDGKIVPHERLSTILVDALEDLVSRSVAESGEEREEFPSKASVGIVLKNDTVELRSGSDLCRIGHETLRNSVDGVEDGQFSDTGRACGSASERFATIFAPDARWSGMVGQR